MLCCQDENSGKKVKFLYFIHFKGTGKKLLEVSFLSEFNFALFFDYIDTSSIPIFLP